MIASSVHRKCRQVDSTRSLVGEGINLKACLLSHSWYCSSYTSSPMAPAPTDLASLFSVFPLNAIIKWVHPGDTKITSLGEPIVAQQSLSL